MKNRHTKKGGSPSALHERHVNRLIVKPIVRRIKRQRAGCLKQGSRLFKKLKEIAESIEIIARQIARKAKRDE